MEPIRVVVYGAAGRVGQVLMAALPQDPALKLVGAVDLSASGDRLTLSDGTEIPFSADLPEILAATRPQVMVDFTIARATMAAVRASLPQGVNLVIGTTGLSAEETREIQQLAEVNQVGVVLAANFTIGAILMMHFARIAARYLDSAEIIELHHNLKIDAPSGTALSTARGMSEARGKPFRPAADFEKHYPSRGLNVGGLNIHSVRLPGLMAHQEVLFGGQGQTLSIRHDTIGRECYVPGVILAIKAVVNRKGLIQGLEILLDL